VSSWSATSFMLRLLLLTEEVMTDEMDTDPGSTVRTL